MHWNTEYPPGRAADDGLPRAARLVWRDHVSGERLSIELISSRAFLEDLIGEGFAVETEDPCAPHPAGDARCRIHTSSSGAADRAGDVQA